MEKQSPEDLGYPEPEGPCSLQEIADYLGVSKTTVQNILNSAIGKVRLNLINDPEAMSVLQTLLKELNDERTLP